MKILASIPSGVYDDLAEGVSSTGTGSNVALAYGALCLLALLGLAINAALDGRRRAARAKAAKKGELPI